MFVDGLITNIVAFLLSLSGIPAFATGNALYFPNINRSIMLEVGLMDWVSLTLVDFFYVFAVWTFVTVRGGGLDPRTYLLFAVLASPILFLGNAIKTFAQVYVLVSSGALGSGPAATTVASAEAVGFASMFGVVLLTVTVTCLFLSQGHAGWPAASKPSSIIP